MTEIERMLLHDQAGVSRRRPCERGDGRLQQRFGCPNFCVMLDLQVVKPLQAEDEVFLGGLAGEAILRSRIAPPRRQMTYGATRPSRRLAPQRSLAMMQTAAQGLP